MQSALDIKLATVVVTALIDSINPCAIGVIILLITSLLKLRENRGRMLFVGSIYIAAVYITYFLAGIGLLYSIHKLQIAEPVSIIVGAIIILAGLVEIKDFFWYGQGISLAIPTIYIATIKKYARTGTIPGVILLGFIVSAVELPCTGGPYLAITALLSRQFDMLALYYLLFYNFIFVLPLIVILALAYFGTQMEHVKKWKMKYRKWMRLATGLLLICLGIVLILYARGIIAL